LQVGAGATSGSKPIIQPRPTMATPKKIPLPRPAAASESAPTRPTTAVSTRPIIDIPACASAIGPASFKSERTSSASDFAGTKVSGAGLS
jgi:hypothetical protein